MIEIHYEADGRVRVQTFSGEVSAEEYVRTIRQLVDAADFDPTIDALIDLRRVTGSDITASAVRSVVGTMHSSRATAPHKLAFVVSSALTMGYARAYQIMSDEGPEEIRIFEEMEEARAWLGLTPEPAG